MQFVFTLHFPKVPKNYFPFSFPCGESPEGERGLDLGVFLTQKKCRAIFCAKMAEICTKVKKVLPFQLKCATLQYRRELFRCRK